MTVTRRIFTQVALGAGLVIAVATTVTYGIVFDATKTRALEHLETYVAERARREEAGFRHIEANLETVRGQFLKRLLSPVPENLQSLWEKHFEKFPDGARRSRKEFADGREFSTMWMHKDTVLTPALQAQILRAQDICDELLPTWRDSFPSLYFNFPGPANIGFDPTIASWVWETPADYDMNAQEWVRVALPENDPSRGLVWTGVLEEEVAKVPQVAVLLPIYLGDEMLCSVAHTVHVRSMMEEATQQILPGVSHLIVRRDGRLIAHPTLTERILTSKGALTAQTSGDATLVRLHDAVLKGQGKVFSGYDAGGELYYVASSLAGPDWFFVTVMPRGLLQEQAFASAQWVLWSGLLSLALVLGVFTVILRRQVAQPLAEFARATGQMSAGDTTARAEISSKDELGRLAGTFNEMTRRVAERDSAIRASERRWRMLFEESPLSVQVYSPEGRSLRVNAGYEKLWGVVPGPDYSLLEDPQLAASGQLAVIRRAFEGEVVFVPAARYDTVLNPFVANDQPRTLWVQAVLYPVFDDAGGVEEVVCIHEDITARKRGEDELRELNQSLEARVAERTNKLRESEERFIKLFQASPTPTVLTRADRTVVAANAAFLKTAGYAEAEVVGKSALDLHLYAVPEQQSEFARIIMESGSIRHREQQLRTKTNGIRTILVSAELLELDGQLHVLTAGLDITERKQAEAETVRALAREKELSELKTNFVSMVSHEFRTPLGVIQSAADVLDRYLDRLTPEDRREHLDMIFRSTRGLAHLVDSVLLLGRVEDGRIQFTPAPLDLARLGRELVDEIQSATAARCPVEFMISSSLEDAQSDADLLRHIITNLLSNAVKYSEPGASVEFTISRDGSDAILTVQDHGIGIPDKDRAHLFTSFARGSNVGQRPGSGLGLLIVQRCVALHSGSLDLQSTPGAGTTVTVRLPVFSNHQSSISNHK